MYCDPNLFCCTEYTQYFKCTFTISQVSNVVDFCQLLLSVLCSCTMVAITRFHHPCLHRMIEAQFII